MLYNKISSINITSTINDFAKENKVPYDVIDFNINAIYTYQVKNGKKEYINNSIDKYDSQYSDLAQEFDIEMFVRKKRKFIIKKKVFLSDNNQDAYMIISKNSKIPFYNEFEKDLFEYINKEKAKLKLITNMNDAFLKTSVEKFVEEIDYEEMSEDQIIHIATNVSYKSSASGYIKYLYTKEKNINTLARTYVYAKKDDVLIDVFKGTKGQCGIDVFGNIIRPKDITQPDINDVNFSSNIQILKENNHIYLIAKKTGMVSFKDGILDISSKINFVDLKLKDCSLFQAPLNDNNIVISIKSSNNHNDAIGSGIKLQASNIVITGNIASNVQITANNIQLFGTLHKNSNITTTNGIIKTAKGHIKAKDINIDKVQHAKIHSQYAQIQDIYGGEVSAKVIEIENLHNHAKLKATSYIKIQTQHGRFNDMTICADAFIENKIKIKNMKKFLKEYNNKYSLDEINNLVKKHNTYLEAIKKLNEKIISQEQQHEDSTKTNKTLKNTEDAVKEIKKIILDYKKYLQYKEELKQFDKKLKNSYIESNSAWTKDNIIIFQKVSSDDRVSLEPIGKLNAICLSSNNPDDIVLSFNNKRKSK